MSDGENGFLTDRDKKFLRAQANDEEYYEGENAKHLRYEAREAIAERARQAFHDFALLYEVLEEHDRDRVFDPPRDEVPELLDAIRDTISFIYWAMEREADEKQPHRTFFYRFDQMLGPALRQAEKRRYDDDPFLNYEPYTLERVQVEAGYVDRLAEALAEGDGDDVPDEMLRSAIQHLAKRTTGEIEPELVEYPDGERMITDLHALAEYVEKESQESDDE